MDSAACPADTLSLSPSLDFLPPGLRNGLLPFQKDGVNFAISKGGRCLIADEMGLGKTLQAIGAAYFYRNEWPLLIIVPASLKYSWVEELERWLPELLPDDIAIVNSTTDISAMDVARVTIVSYGVLRSGSRHSTLVRQALTAKKFEVVIADESHSIKNISSKTCQAVTLIMRRARRCLLLSGTPALNRPAELFTQIDVLRNGMVGSWSSYTKKYCDARMVYFGKTQRWSTSGASNLEELEKRLRGEIMIRRLKKDVLTQLPPKRRQKMDFDIKFGDDSEQLREEIASSLNQLETLLSSKGVTVMDLMANKAVGTNTNELIMFRQLISSLYNRTCAAKVGPVTEFIKYCCENKSSKMLVFAHHRVMLDGLQQALWKDSVKHIRIDGSVNPIDRAALVKQFQTDSQTRVALLSILAAGQGLTLTAASSVVFAELFWTPAVLEQCEDRAHRIGQANSVNVYYLVARGTLDELIWSILRRKTTVLAKALDGVKRQLNVDDGDKSAQHLLAEAPAVVPTVAIGGVADAFDIDGFFSSEERKAKGQLTLTEMLTSTPRCHKTADGRKRKRAAIQVLETSHETSALFASGNKLKKVKKISKASCKKGINFSQFFDVSTTSQSSTRGSFDEPNSTKPDHPVKADHVDQTCQILVSNIGATPGQLQIAACQRSDMCSGGGEVVVLDSESEQEQLTGCCEGSTEDSLCTSVLESDPCPSSQKCGVDVSINCSPHRSSFEKVSGANQLPGDGLNVKSISPSEPVETVFPGISNLSDLCCPELLQQDEAAAAPVLSAHFQDLASSNLATADFSGPSSDDSTGSCSDGFAVIRPTPADTDGGALANLDKQPLDWVQEELRSAEALLAGISGSSDFLDVSSWDAATDVRSDEACWACSCGTSNECAAEDCIGCGFPRVVAVPESLLAAAAPGQVLGPCGHPRPPDSSTCILCAQQSALQTDSDDASSLKSQSIMDSAKQCIPYSKLFFRVSAHTTRVHVFNEVKQPLGVNFHLTDADDQSLLPDVLQIPKNLIHVQCFVTSWNRLKTREQAILIKRGELVDDAETVYLWVRSVTVRTCKQRYITKDDIAFAATSAATATNGNLRVIRPNEKSTRKPAGASDQGMAVVPAASIKSVISANHEASSSQCGGSGSVAKDGRCSAASGDVATSGIAVALPSSTGYVQAVAADGTPLCLVCRKPFQTALLAKEVASSSDNAWQTRFCSRKCSDEHRTLTSHEYGRLLTKRFDAGICEQCGVNTLHIFSRVRATSSMKERSQLIQDSCYRTLPKRLKVDMVKQPTEGQFWQADHIRPVYAGGGQCDMDNLRTLCTPCHYSVTANQAQQRKKARKLGGIIGTGTITKFFTSSPQ